MNKNRYINKNIKIDKNASKNKIQNKPSVFLNENRPSIPSVPCARKDQYQYHKKIQLNFKFKAKKTNKKK